MKASEKMDSFIIVLDGHIEQKGKGQRIVKLKEGEIVGRN